MTGRGRESQVGRLHKFEMHDEDGAGWVEVYEAKEVDRLLSRMRKELESLATDRKILQHGNVARMILGKYFWRKL